MKFMVAWTVSPGVVREAVEQFLATGAAPQEGVTMLGRWHRLDGNGGFSLYETSRPEQLYKGVLKWADLLEFETYPVIDDAQAAPILADVFKP